jgi:cell wall-associated NlpC family hydrolase
LKYPKYGVDCSGFIYACYNLALGATTSPKIAYYYTGAIPNSGVWKRIDDSQLKPGDILNNKDHGHVVMYMGKDSGGYQVIEAQCAGTYVKCSYPWTKTSGYVAYRYTGLK